MKLSGKIIGAILLIGLFLPFITVIAGPFTPRVVSNGNQFQSYNVSPAIDTTSLALSNDLLGFYSPVSLGVNYDRIMGAFYNANYSRLLTSNFGMSILGELGNNNYRLNATIGTAIRPNLDVVLTNTIGSAQLTGGYTYSAIPNLTSCKYDSLTVYDCAGVNLNAFPNTFINVQGGLTCALAVGITPLVTTIKSLTQLEVVTVPLLYTGCQITLCADSACAGLQSNTVVFGGL
jgi:hypothetical protein